MKKIIVTYFEPFGDRDTNASKEVVLNMVSHYEKISLPISWKRTLPILNEIMDSDPRYLFMVGEAGNYSDVTVELVARNICNGIDVDGNKKDKERILRATPKTIPTNFKIDNIPFTNSDNAGKYLCNYVYYIALLKSEVTKIVFIHVPYINNKGSNTLENVTQKVKDIINYFIENDDGFLVRLKGKVTKININNAYELYPDLRKEYHWPNIIIALDEKEDGSFVMKGRADGFKGVWYEYGDKKADQGKAIQSIYFKIARYQDGLDKEDRDNINRRERTSRFNLNEYKISEKLIKRHINLFVARADYTDELSFYKSLDRIHQLNLKSSLDEDEELALNSAKEYVSRLGMEKSKQLLFRIVER